MPLVKFFVIVILLACMHSCGKYPADGGSADTDKLYAEGMAELKENQYNKALSKLLRYVQIEERNSRKDTLNLMKAYYNVGGIYSIYSDFAQALELYKKGYALGQASDNDEMQFKFLTNMIGASCYISKPELADGLNENLLRLKGISKGRRMYYYYFNKGFIAGSHGDYDGKARWMEKAIAAADRYGLPDDMKVYAYSEVYQCYENRGDLYKALSALARLTESNTNYVSQAINSNFGKNFRTYLNEYRIKVAMKRMMDTDRFGNYSIHGIAESVGFKSDSNFISAFRKVTGMTPSLYQKLSKDDSLISNS